MSGSGVMLRPEPASVREARRFVDDRLAVLGYAGAAPVAELLVSELVTNAILHARTPVTVSVERRGDVARVAVADGSSRAPQQRRHSVDSGTGRGLRLVASMASRWGVDATETGKVVWFELSREPAPDLDVWDDLWET